MIFFLTALSESFISRFPKTRFFLSHYYKKRLDAEVLNANICSTDIVCCVGGGAFPATAIGIHERTQARVCVVDHNPKAVYKAQRVLKKLNLDHVIEVVCHDGSQCPFDSFQVVHIARQVTPRNTIVSKALETMMPGSRVIVRTENHSHIEKQSFCKLNYNGGFNKETLVYLL